MVGLVAGEAESRHSCVLLLTRDQLYVWDTPSDTLSQELAISSCSVSSSEQQDGEMELRIATTVTPPPSPKEREQTETSGLEMVRHYLQQAVSVESGGAVSRDMELSGDCSLEVNVEEEADTTATDADMGQAMSAPGPGEGAEEGEGPLGLVVCVEVGSGNQLLAVLEAIQHFYSHPEDVYAVQ